MTRAQVLNAMVKAQTLDKIVTDNLPAGIQAITPRSDVPVLRIFPSSFRRRNNIGMELDSMPNLEHYQYVAKKQGHYARAGRGGAVIVHDERDAAVVAEIHPSGNGSKAVVYQISEKTSAIFANYFGN